jgi:hypothetical protein
MVEEIHQPDGGVEHPTVRYERSDASFRWIMVILLGALVFAVIVEFSILTFFHYYRDYEAEIKKSPHPLAPGPSTALPHEPRLEQIDRLAGVETPNVFEREAANLVILNSYGPTREEGFIHIPIDRAMQQLIEEKKLPARPEPPADQTKRSGGLIDAGASNSGRRFIKEEPK